VWLRAADGPLADASFTVDTCPELVRLVIAADGTPDILNRPEDAPRLDEQVHWYRLRRGIAGHLCGRGGCEPILELEHAPDLRPLQAPDPVNPGAQLELVFHQDLLEILGE
jgi:hypothetical protein